MAFALRNLQQYLDLLRRNNELVDINVAVDPYLEAAEIHRRIIAQEGPAILFHKIKGSPYRLATNLFGNKQRIELAFGSHAEQTLQSIIKLIKNGNPPSFRQIIKNRNAIWQGIKLGTRQVKCSDARCSKHSTADLNSLPLLTTWHKDAGPFVTLPLVYTEHPETAVSNIGMYRMQRFNSQQTGFHTQIGKGAGYHLAAAKTLNRKLPVNVFIGGPPAVLLSAIAPLPENVPEILLASFMQTEKIRMAPNPIGPLPILADAEFTLIGEVDPNNSCPEGPFGDHYGYYSQQDNYPLFFCKGILHSPNPIFTATVVGKPRQEDAYLGDYIQELLAPIIPIVMPAVMDLWSYAETGYHSLAAAIVKQRFKREAMASAFRILGESQLTLTKFLLVLDKAQNLRDFKAVLTHVLERADFSSDLYVLSNLAMDTLDFTGPAINQGSKGILLGVGEPIRTLPKSINQDLPRCISKAESFCPGCLVVQGDSYEQHSKLPEVIATELASTNWPLIVLVDNVRSAIESTTSFLWETFTRFEPAQDIYAATKTIDRNHISYTAPIVIDARMKPGYPDAVCCDEKTAQLVDNRWDEYFS